MAYSGRSIPDIFSDLVVQLTTLVRHESQLAQAEISENIGKTANGLGFMVGAAVLIIPALVILLDAAVAGIEAAGLAIYWAALIVGGAALLLGLALLLIGKSRIAAQNIIPTRTMHQLGQDASVARQQFRTTPYGNTSATAENATEAAAARVARENAEDNHEQQHRAA